MTEYRLLLLTLLPLVGCADTACMSMPEDATECPAAADVDIEKLSPATCGAEVLGVIGEATELDHCPGMAFGGDDEAAACEYPVTIDPPWHECTYGRPLVIDGRPRLAPLARGGGWAASAGSADGARSEDPAERLARALTWVRIALAEHASVASFSRFALDLLAFGAPADLVADAHAAALDEVRHAKLAFGLAQAAGGEALRPGPLPLAELALADDLAAFAAATAREGCVAETLSALQMAAARDRATDPAERAALAVIARDEARHAALAWRTVRWMIDVGGDAVRDAVARALAAPPALPVDAEGLLSAEEVRAVVGRGWREVVAPAAAALLGGREVHAHA